MTSVLSHFIRFPSSIHSFPDICNMRPLIFNIFGVNSISRIIKLGLSGASIFIIILHCPNLMHLFIPCCLVLEKMVRPAEQLYGTIVRVWVLIFPFFAILDPEDLQIILSSGKHTEKIFFYKLLHNFLGNGLITSSGRC